ncbi:DUF4296 domain-containing protein [Pedobacter xixiisoli]|uniref:DUF4296 domain-containing protein n=1 Tax=Pedobacter xixiisoli TaxID=1476464 RepID=A0A285ZTP9_9SPHI|nr:DUF4296 domain-containing protein [Pedobacter xixiisoli]SOD13002.1 protein of unknown function [Pedobacter xixiisoli]
MTRFLLLLLSVLSIAACKPGIPKDIVQPNEMEKVLFDIHLVDGYIANIPTQDSARKVGAPIYKGIFKKYGIDSAMHAKSMAYYYNHPDLLSKMYDRISEKMGKTRDEEAKKREKEEKLKAEKELKKQKAAEAKRTDSLKKLKKANQIDTSRKVRKPLKALISAPKSTKK